MPIQSQLFPVLQHFSIVGSYYHNMKAITAIIKITIPSSVKPKTIDFMRTQTFEDDI